MPEATTASPIVNGAVKAAKDLPDLVDKLQAVDPALAQQIEGKALIASKTPWGTLGISAVTWASAKYGLGWDADTCALVTGMAVLLGSYVMRYLTTSPISGWFEKKPVVTGPAVCRAP